MRNHDKATLIKAISRYVDYIDTTISKNNDTSRDYKVKQYRENDEYIIHIVKEILELKNEVGG